MAFKLANIKILLEGMNHEKIDYIPTTEKLAGIVAILGQSDDSLNILNRVLRHSFFEENYDYIIIDCQPSITLVVSNVLKCADKVLIPVQADEPAYSGVKKLLEKISQIKGDLDISKYSSVFYSQWIKGVQRYQK